MDGDIHRRAPKREPPTATIPKVVEFRNALHPNIEGILSRVGRRGSRAAAEWEKMRGATRDNEKKF